MKRILIVILVIAAIGYSGDLFAASTKDYAVQISAAIQTTPPKITLSWVQDTSGVPTSYTVYRKLKSETAWYPLATLSGSTLAYDDTNVAMGNAYEYKVHRLAVDHAGYGYIFVGIDAPLSESRGKVILLVDITKAQALVNELNILEQDLVGDGWQVVRHDVSRVDSVANIKNIIKADYNADPDNIKSVFLFGRVPVPYSGDLAPDGHYPDHAGAWPADAYYVDMVGAWTDTSVNDIQASAVRNENIPGDGKFDQNVLYTPVKLEIGRVDLFSMTSLPGSPTELDLLRRYLNKDHAFRHKLINPEKRGLIGDNFGVFSGEAFAAGGWRNFSSFFGPANISTAASGQWIPMLKDTSYLWAYGCGGGSYTSASGIGNTTDLVTNDVKTVFTMLFGSYFGDWDSTNNFLRSPLATPTYGLTCVWSGRPDWAFHHMALGETIGYGARLTQNNLGSGGLYSDYRNSSAGYVHVALMGDPTLRMHVVAPVSSLDGSKSGLTVSLSWNASSDTVLGYNVYRADSMQGKFTRLNSSLITATAYTDNNSLADNPIYMVRAVKKEDTASGTYYNASQGVFWPAPNLMPGDMSGDGTISAFDASLVAQHAVGLITLNSEQASKADVTGDVTISAYDASLIAQKAVGLITEFPVEQSVTTYSLNLLTTGYGSVAINPLQAAYAPGTQVILTANSTPVYFFSSWSGNLTGTTNPVTITMDSNKTITANFTVKAYTLTINAVNGTVTKSPNQATYVQGTQVTLTATPNTGYTFTNWSGSISSPSNPVYVIMDSNKTITANFQ